MQYRFAVTFGTLSRYRKKDRETKRDRERETDRPAETDRDSERERERELQEVIGLKMNCLKKTRLMYAIIFAGWKNSKVKHIRK